MRDRERTFVKFFIIFLLMLGVVYSFRYYWNHGRIIIQEHEIYINGKFKEIQEVRLIKADWKQDVFAKFVSAALLPIAIGILLQNRPQMFTKKDLYDKENAYLVVRLNNIGFFLIIAGFLTFIGTLLSS